MPNAQRRTITPSVHHASQEQIDLMLAALDQSQLDSELPDAPPDIKKNDDALFYRCFDWFKLRGIEIIYDEDIAGWRRRAPGEE